jgi:hypothetical protein
MLGRMLPARALRCDEQLSMPIRQHDIAGGWSDPEECRGNVGTAG